MFHHIVLLSFIAGAGAAPQGAQTPGTVQTLSLRDDPVAEMLATLAPQGITDAATLKTRLLTDAAPALELSPLLQHAGDLVTLEAMWSKDLQAHPANALAAESLIRLLLQQGKWADAANQLDAIAAQQDHITDEGGKAVLADLVAPWRCETYVLDRRAQAAQACRDARQMRLSFGLRGAGRLALAERNYPLARDALLVALTRDVKSGRTWYWLGVSDALNGDVANARAAWNEAVRVWPEFSPALAALVTPPRDLSAALDAELTWTKRSAARQLARCGRVYTSLGVPERANRCFDAAEALDPGMGAAARRLSSPQSVTTSNANVSSHPLILATEAEEALSKRSFKLASQLLSRARTADPGATEVHLVVDALCRQTPKDALCVSDRQPLLRAATVRDETSFARAMNQVDSRYVGYAAPRINHFELEPWSERAAFPEVEGLSAILEQRFPGVRFTMRPLKKTPVQAIDPMREQVIDARIFGAMPRDRGLVVVVDRDLGFADGNFLFGTTQFETVRGIVSAARFRTEEGYPAPPSQVLSSAELAKARERLSNQVTSTVAKLLGMSFPCSQKKCVLRFPRDRKDFDEKGGDFCKAHQDELQTLLK